MAETHLNLDSDDRTIWHITTDDSVMIEKFRRLGATITKQRGATIWFTIPAKQVLLRNMPQERTLTDEQRAVLTERMAAMRAKQAVQP